MKEGSLDRFMWRDDFERPVVRQTAEWMNELLLGCHSGAVVLTVLQRKQRGISIHKRNNIKTQYK